MPADLTTATDIELDAALMIGYRQHGQAKTKAKRLEIHMAVQAILDEQSHRHDAWLASLPPVPISA